MSMNIKINEILMAAVLLLTFSVVSEAAEFSIGNYTVNDGEQITSQIELKDVVNFGTATISLLYDPSVVHVTTVSNGNIPLTTMTNNINFPINGSTRILIFTSDIPGPNGSFIFSNINLKAVGNVGSQSILSISIQEFADTDGHPMNYTVRDGIFSIKPSVSSATPIGREKQSAETPVPTPTTPDFLIITSIIAILYIYLTLKK